MTRNEVNGQALQSAEDIFKSTHDFLEETMISRGDRSIMLP